MPVDVEQQQSTRDPAQPSYIFRGHTAHIHSVQTLRRNTCLLTGDADGWVVYWKLETKRPLAVWKAHDAAILGTAEWGPDKIITHGRDNTLRIWQLRGHHASYSTVLPADGTDVHRPKPWLLHSLPVNTLNFCAFTVCYQRGNTSTHQGRAAPDDPTTRPSEPIYIAVPGRDDKKAEVYQFPDEKLICAVPRIDTSDTGMVMALKLVHHRPSDNTLVIAGYEGGFTAVHLVPRNAAIRTSALNLAQIIYLSRPHTQPILSVDALPDGSTYFTSSADVIIAAHRVPELPANSHVEDIPAEGLTNNTSGASAVDDPKTHNIGFSIEGSTADGDVTKIINADPDAPTPPNIENAPPKPSETASGIDFPPSEPLSFPKRRPPISTPPLPNNSNPPPRPSGLSSLLAAAPQQPKLIPTVKSAGSTDIQPAHKIVNTKHAGQQSLKVRSDGRLLVTGGWDSRVRVYSTKTLKEVAVLKWHKEGVYAVSFGEVLGPEDLEKNAEEQNTEGDRAQVMKKATGLAKLQKQREEAIQRKHWVVAGAKDGKVSLWEVF